MELTTITMDPAEAEQHAAELEAHRKHLTAEEESFLAGYKALATGKPVINLRDTIAAGGCFEGTDRYAAPLPKLAVARPYDAWVHLFREFDGSVGFSTPTFNTWSAKPRGWVLRFPPGTLRRLVNPEYATRGSKRAMVPPVPLATRLRLGVPGGGGWRRCLTLFEVGEWADAPRPPGDPALLRHLAGDLYMVEATWDLTELEQAVLAGRNTR